MIRKIGLATFYALGAIGLIDLTTQMATSGRVELLQMLFSAVLD